MARVFFFLLFIDSSIGQFIPKLVVSNGELEEVAEELRRVDDNAAREGQIEVDYGGRVPFNDPSDYSPRPLFTYVDPSLQKKPTYRAFIALFDNYERRNGVEEPVVSEEEDVAEMHSFIDEVGKTRPFRVLLEFLQERGHPYGESAEVLKEAIAHLWFDRYSRSRGVMDSSGFEHVFLGEAKRGEIGGLHNWIRLYLIEMNDATFDYKGYTVTRGDHLATIRFQWGDEWKKIGGGLMGTSPEYDLSLFTLCFLARRGRETCKVNIDGCPFSIQSYDIRRDGELYVGTAFPVVGGRCRQG